MTLYAINTEGLTKKYKGITAVDSLTFSVLKGELYTLLGLNGAGKTTAIKMLTCITTPDGGDAYVCGKSIIKESEKVKMLIGVSPQETAVAPNLTVKENLEIMCAFHGLNKSKRESKINEMTDTFDLGQILSKKAGKLSGGWQRRLSIAMALISEPEVIFLDEPTLGLDVIARRELWQTVRALKGKITVILTTHYMEEAQELSDRIGIMKKGKLLLEGTVDEIMHITGKNKFENAFIEIVKEGV